MKKMIILMFVLTAVIYAAECVIYPPITQEQVPFTFDATKAPAKIIDWAEIPYGVPTVWEFTACDAEDDPYTIVPLVMPATATFDGKTFRWTPTKEEKGVHYITFMATDNPPEGLLPLSDTSSYVVNVKRMVNTKPNLHKIKK